MGEGTRWRRCVGISLALSAVAIVGLSQQVALADSGAVGLTDTAGSTLDPATGGVIQTVNDTTDAVQSTVNDTTDAVQTTVNDTTDAVQTSVNDTTDAVQTAVNDTTDAVQTTVNDTTDAVQTTVNDTTDAVQTTVNDTETSALPSATGVVSGAGEVASGATVQAGSAAGASLSSADPTASAVSSDEGAVSGAAPGVEAAGSTSSWAGRGWVEQREAFAAPASWASTDPSARLKLSQLCTPSDATLCSVPAGVTDGSLGDAVASIIRQLASTGLELLSILGIFLSLALSGASAIAASRRRRSQNAFGW